VTRPAARDSLATLAMGAVAVTVACSAGAGKSTVRVAPTPNSEAAKTGPQVLADAARALATVPTVHVVGTKTDGDLKLTLKADIRAQTDGGDGSMQSSAGSLEMRLVRGHVYYNGTAGFFEATMEPKSAAEKMAGHWIYEDVAFGQDPPLTPKGLSEEIGDDDGVTVASGVTTETLDGQPVVVVRESDGSRMDVAATGAPLPLKISGTGAGDAGFAVVGNVTFTYGEAPVQLRVPAGAALMPVPSFGALPSDFPTAFPSNFMSFYPSGIPTDLPSDLPSALASELRSFAAAHGGSTSGVATPTPTP
jgi:hypothetical protein